MTLGQSSTPLENRSRAALLHKEGSPCRVTKVPFSPNGLGRGVRGGRRAKLGGGRAAPGPGREMINHGRLSPRHPQTHPSPPADRPSPASPVTRPAQRGKDKATEQGTLPVSSPPPPSQGWSLCMSTILRQGWVAGWPSAPTWTLPGATAVTPSSQSSPAWETRLTVTHSPFPPARRGLLFSRGAEQERSPAPGASSEGLLAAAVSAHGALRGLGPAGRAGQGLQWQDWFPRVCLALTLDIPWERSPTPAAPCPSERWTS